MRKLKGLNAKVEMNPVHKVPRRIYDISPSAAPGEPPATAAAAVLSQQYHDGKPISDAWIRIDLDREGRVSNIQSDLIPTAVLDKAATKAVAA